MAMPPQDQRPEWLPSGFPPRSFPAGPPESAPAPAPVGATPPAAGRGRWLAAIAALVALILLAGGLFAATRGGDDDDEAQLATGPSSTEADTSFPTFDTSTTAPAVETTVSIAPVTTAAATSTTAPPSTAAAGLLEVAPSTLVLAKTDATAGATRGTVTLRNVGGSPLTFTAQSNVAGLTAAPARGNLAPGASAGVTVTLDASRIPAEGPFSGTVSFGGTGGVRTINVSSTTGRPPEFTDNVGETCATASTTCSRQIRLDTNPSAPNPSPCNTAWAYAVTITDQSQITSARAIARRNVSNADALLQQAAGTNIFISNSFPPLGSGTLRFALEATDVHGFTRRLPEQTIAC
jgi:hypothetical protein